MNRFGLFITVIGASLSCATHGTTADPFTPIGAARLPQMGVVAVAPISVGADITLPDSLVARIDSAIVAELEAGGFTVVPPADYEHLWSEVYRYADPIFDQHTGQRNEEAYQAAWNAFYEELGARYHGTVVLFPEIWEVDVEVSDGYARWDGTSQNMASTGDQILAILDILVSEEDGGGGNDFLPSGYVEALTLSIVVEDSSGTPLYSHRAGISSLRKRITSDRYTGLDLAEHHERIDDAIRRALKPLLDAYREREGQPQAAVTEPIATSNR